jgi:hypothetical protein
VKDDLIRFEEVIRQLQGEFGIVGSVSNFVTSINIVDKLEEQLLNTRVNNN